MSQTTHTSMASRGPVSPRHPSGHDRARKPVNLLDNRLLSGFLRSRWYPTVFQVPVLIGTVFIIYELVTGPLDADQNVGATVMWVLWWSALPIALLVVGRFWCAICPFGLVSDLVQKLVGANRPVPRALRRNAIWITVGVFLVVTWVEHIWGVSESPRSSAVLLLLVTAAAVLFGAGYERRTWCRYVCFIGGLSSNYARAGMLELRATRPVCSGCEVEACYKGGAGGAGCHMFEYARAMDTSAQCDYCAGCLKNCPNDSIRLSPRIPTRELWTVRRPRFEVSFLAVAIVGIVLLENVSMLPLWEQITDWVSEQFGTESSYFTFTFAFVPTVLAPVALVGLAAFVAARLNGRTAKQNFAQFGYSFIPFGIAVHIAHSLFHLLAEGKSVLFSFQGLFGADLAGRSTAVVGAGTIKILQQLLIVAGTAAALYTAHRLATGRRGDRNPRASFVANAVPIVVLAVVNAVLFSMPMAMVM